jgi:hypothetical protein
MMKQMVLIALLAIAGCSASKPAQPRIQQERSPEGNLIVRVNCKDMSTQVDLLLPDRTSISDCYTLADALDKLMKSGK